MRLEVAHCAGQDYHPAQLIYWLSYTRAAQLVRSNKETSRSQPTPNHRWERWLTMEVHRHCASLTGSCWVSKYPTAAAGCPTVQAAAGSKSKQRGAHVSRLDRKYCQRGATQALDRFLSQRKRSLSKCPPNNLQASLQFRPLLVCPIPPIESFDKLLRRLQASIQES